MDNPQVTLPYIAGLFEGEGSFGLYLIKRTNADKEPRSNITFTNTEPEIIQSFINFCKQHSLSHHVKTDIRSGKSKICYSVSITRMESRIRFIDLIMPYLKGKKIHEGSLVKQFCVGRLEAQVNYIPKRNESGHFVGGYRNKMNENDFALVEQFSMLRAPQRLHASLPHIFS